MPSLGVSSLDFDRVVQTMRSFFSGPGGSIRRRAAGRRSDARAWPSSRRRSGARSSASASKPACFLKRPLVHVEAAIDLDLQRMKPSARPSVMFGDEAAGIGLVVGDGVAHRHSSTIACSVSAGAAAAPNRSPMMKSGRNPLSPRRIEAGIEWQSISTAWPNVAWVRWPSAVSARRDRACRGVRCAPPPRPAAAARNKCRAPRRPGCGTVPSPPATRAERMLAKDGTGSANMRGIEFPRLAVDVEIGARKIRGQQRRAERHGAAEQLVDDSNPPSGGWRCGRAGSSPGTAPDSGGRCAGS